jgi:hypothetical protein
VLWNPGYDKFMPPPCCTCEPGLLCLQRSKSPKTSLEETTLKEHMEEKPDSGSRFVPHDLRLDVCDQTLDGVMRRTLKCRFSKSAAQKLLKAALMF